MAEPAVTVVIPTYNRATLVPRAVASALANTGPGDEVIVVDDGSTDDTEAALAPLRDRIRYVRAPHGGAGAARNHGIRLACHPLVAFLDSDDEWLPDKLRLQRALMRCRPEVLFCFSNFAVREQGGVTRPRYLLNWHLDPRGWDQILGPGVSYSAIAPLPASWADFPVHFGSLYLPEMERDYVPTFTMVVRREAAGDALHFAQDVATFEDWECIARLARAGVAAYLDCETACQHGHDGARVTDANALVRATSRLRILERVWGADEELLARHGELFAAVRARHYLTRAGCLLRAGQTRAARADLRQAGACPLGYRVLAALPGPVVRGLLGLRRAFRKQVAS
jgi:glycosyltransferase involved in cell wall biosynthesis